jgi:RNA polymerase sigma-70 factor (ECF subfamily)
MKTVITRGFQPSRIREGFASFPIIPQSWKFDRINCLPLKSTIPIPMAFDKLTPRSVEGVYQPMKPIPGTLQEGGAGFQTTHWTLVMRARETQSDTSSQKALSDFCQAYWPPLYAFVRHRGHASPEAQDLVQGFFAHLLEQNTLSRADSEKGKLRTFLLGSFQNFLFNEYDRAHALKRGGGHQIVSINDHLPEAEVSIMGTMHLSDSAAYDVAWASQIVKRAWQQLENAFEAEGKKEWLEVLRPFVAGGGKTPLNQEEAAQKLGVPIATLRTWLSRLRQRYREALRTEVASTVSDPADIDQELHYLYQILMA